MLAQARSDTHQLQFRGDGFREELNPSYELALEDGIETKFGQVF
jgi:hypothetical protein